MTSSSSMSVAATVKETLVPASTLNTFPHDGVGDANCGAELLGSQVEISIRKSTATCVRTALVIEFRSSITTWHEYNCPTEVKRLFHVTSPVLASMVRPEGWLKV